MDVRIDTELKKVVFIFLPIHHSFSSHFTVVNHTKSSKCVPEYIRNNETIVSPESTEPDEMEILSSVILYKKFLIKNMKNSSIAAMVQELYEAIDGNEELNIENSLKTLLLEACEFERNYFELKQSIDMYSTYRRLFDRVESLKVREQNDDDKRVLSHLKLILLFKLEDIQADYNFILNLEAYAELTVRKIDLRNRKLPAIMDIDNVELQNNLNDLRFGVNGNFILAEYYHVIKGFGQTYFPFAVDYLKIYSIPMSHSVYNDLNDLTTAATNNLKRLNDSIRTLVSNNEEHMSHRGYTQRKQRRHALVIWKNSDYRDEIRKLFEGEKITLLGDVKQPKKDFPLHFNAMKSNTFEIVFRSSNRTVNKQLKNLLNSFELELNHTGLAATRCNNKFFNMTTEPIFMRTSLFKLENGTPATRTLTYDKIKENQPTLSPYALWEIQLAEVGKNYPSYRNISELAPFTQFDFDIELYGTGEYIAEDVSICDNENLTKFYTQI